ncbi:MAG: hypothetical protein AB8F74_00550, partial [Saprospiraceae bacterium]
KILKINDVVFDKDNHKKYCELRAFLKRSDVESISVVIQRGEDVLNCNLLKFDLMNALRSFK